MIRNIAISLVLMVFFSCKEKSALKNDVKMGSEIQKDYTENNFNWRMKIIDFQPNEIDLSRNQFLHDESLINFLSDELISKDDREYVVNVILLKLYLYHLQQANQGYNLLTMRNNENAKAIIDYFFEQNSISINQEFVNSAVAYNLLKDKTIKDDIINELKKMIEAELAVNDG